MEEQFKINRKTKNPLTDRWTWKMAWKDARFNLSRLFLFISSIIIGVAGMVAINSFNANMQSDMDAEAKELLGADLSIDSGNKKLEDEIYSFVDSLSSETARDARFGSMVYFPKNGGSRLIRVIALQGGYPFYGEVVTTPSTQVSNWKSGSAALIDESLSIQFNISAGDSLKLGNAKFAVAGIVTHFPGSTNMTATFAPSVYIPFNELDRTGLVQYGSRIEYNYYFKMDPGKIKAATDSLDNISEAKDIHWETAETEKDNLSRGFQNLYKYFKLLGFVALILGCIGVASSIFVYMREKRNSVAVLRCIGANGWQIFSIFFVQVVCLGLLGSILGVLAGLGIQYFIPWVVKDFLPMEVNVAVSWIAVGEGLLLGMIISILFSALPLSNVRFIPPLEILRASETNGKIRSKFRIFIICLILLFPWLFALRQTNDILNGTIFYLGLLVTFFLLSLVSKGLIWLVKKALPTNAKFIWKQAFSNLWRPNNQTTVLVVVIGLGAFLISTMTLVQDSLLGQVELSGSGNKSNTVLFDIQPYQKEGVEQLLDQYSIDVQQTVPIVTMRIQSFRGKPVEEWAKDSTEHISDWALTHEYRVTYRDSLISSEILVDGQLEKGNTAEGDSIFISIENRLAERLNLKLKDQIVFNVQGVPLTTYVGSLREVDWQRVQTNFMVVFPKGVLEDAPQFYVMVARIDNKEKAAKFQQDLVQKFPNVSLIDLNLILQTLDEIFDKVAFAIRFMALFSILTGMLVLSGAVINSKYARLKENVLLRTIGAVKKQINGMTIIEYGYLGIFAGLSGSLLAVIASWLLSIFFFETIFLPDFATLLLIWIFIAFMTVAIGWYNTRSILNKSPLEVLRKEG